MPLCWTGKRVILLQTKLGPGYLIMKCRKLLSDITWTYLYGTSIKSVIVIVVECLFNKFSKSLDTRILGLII